MRAGRELREIDIETLTVLRVVQAGEELHANCEGTAYAICEGAALEAAREVADWWVVAEPRRAHACDLCGAEVGEDSGKRRPDPLRLCPEHRTALERAWALASVWR